MKPRETRYKESEGNVQETVSIAFGFFGIMYFIVHLAIHL